MPTLTSPPTLVGANGTPVNGRVALMPTATYSYGATTVTTALAAGVVRNGQFYGADGESPLVIYPTPANVGLRIVLYLEEVTGSGTQEHGISRVVTVPNVATVAWVNLVDVVPPVEGGSYVVPPWASVVIYAVDQVEADADRAEVARDAAIAAAGGATGAVRYDIAQTSLTAAQELQARNNIGAVSAADVAALAPADHDHTADDITDAGTTGKAVMRAATAATARAALSALNSPNGSMSGMAFYSSVAGLPVTGTTGVLYIVPEA